ncbi:PLP-dependent aminotransferase family protein [Paenibacillus sp. ACRRX]|uniref:aminotransferase-like domain-containing protein n=1 Tax=Paenibacillus sp. ACRRX TaxID=2918206 RepID=UPI001EF696D1|nr:PLP-dependent aminotransferase family protein [Paenibacillus sp. ACRRX]MCG7409950.1 PLP-dependent aminotransferase family protein [Paenibacillus sp. ACRRX]
MKKYDAILSDMEEKIKNQQYKPGHKLPSVRSAAALYHCSISTIIRAYAELEKRHAIYSIPQSGFYVVDILGNSCDNADNDMIDFASASPDINVFPYLDFQHCLNKAIDTYKYNLFTYGDTHGLDKLRHTLVSHLASDQVFAPAERIFVTSGIQPVLELLSNMDFPGSGTSILVEQPGYDIYLRYLESKNIPVIGIARTAAGIDLAAVEAHFSSGKIKFFYTMPRYQNPLGTTLSADERKAIAELATKYDVFIVEDDYMADLGAERNFEPIFAYNRSSHVIYVKSFSKIIFPGLRLGAAVLPERLINKFNDASRYGDTSLLSQAALEVYINNGMYERHKHKIISQYEERIRLLNEAVGRYNEAGLIEVPVINSGIYIQFKLPQKVNLEQLTKRLAKRKVHVVSGRGFYLNDYAEREKFIRISISRAKSESIDDGVKAIIEEIQQGIRW